MRTALLVMRVFPTVTVLRPVSIIIVATAVLMLDTLPFVVRVSMLEYPIYRVDPPLKSETITALSLTAVPG